MPAPRVRLPWVIGFAVVELCFGSSAALWIGADAPAIGVAAAAEGAPASTRILADFLQRSRSVSTAEAQREFAVEALAAVDQVLRDDDLSAALRLATLAADAATKSRNRYARFLAQSRRDDLLQAARDFKDLQRQLDQLSKSPGDSDANAYVGRFVCAVARDWERGLPMLARGSDAEYQLAARAELAGASRRHARIALASQWAALAKSEQKASLRFALSERASHWFRQALQGAGEAEGAAINRAMSEQLPLQYLTEMQESEVIPGPWPLGKFGTIGDPMGRRITISRIPALQGLGLHPPDRGAHAAVEYRLGGNWETMAFGVGLSDTTLGLRSSVVFTVLGDGKVLWKSRPLKAAGDADFFRVSVKNVDKLELRTECSGSHVGAHAVWVDPHVLK